MREINKLNTKESITQQKLIFEEGWLDKFNRLTVYLVFSPFIFIPVEMIFTEKFTTPNDIFILYFVFPALILSGLYIFYRNAMEKRLIKVYTNLKKQKARQLLLNFAKDRGYEIYRKSDDCLIFNEDFNEISSHYRKTRIFFVQDDIILFGILRDNFKLNMPIFFSHIFLKRELKKLTRNASLSS